MEKKKLTNMEQALLLFINENVKQPKELKERIDYEILHGHNYRVEQEERRRRLKEMSV